MGRGLSGQERGLHSGCAPACVGLRQTFAAWVFFFFLPRFEFARKLLLSLRSKLASLGLRTTQTSSMPAMRALVGRPLHQPGSLEAIFGSGRSRGQSTVSIGWHMAGSAVASTLSRPKGGRPTAVPHGIAAQGNFCFAFGLLRLKKTRIVLVEYI